MWFAHVLQFLNSLLVIFFVAQPQFIYHFILFLVFPRNLSNHCFIDQDSLNLIIEFHFTFYKILRRVKGKWFNGSCKILVKTVGLWIAIIFQSISYHVPSSITLYLSRKFFNKKQNPEIVFCFNHFQYSKASRSLKWLKRR